MSEPDPVTELARAVLQSSREVALGLMRANYVEREVWELPGGKIKGLAPEARDIAVYLRDSIWARFDSLRFHRQLIDDVSGGMAVRLAGCEDDDQRFDVAWTATWHSHYLLDDLVFNAASLFDYVGNAIWFGFHGQNHIKRKWKKAYQAAKSAQVEKKSPGQRTIYASSTGDVILATHFEVVDALYEYRSDLIHNRLDGPDVFRGQFWYDILHRGRQLPLPERFKRRLGPVIAGHTDDSPDMLMGSHALVAIIGEVTLRLLAALKDDLGPFDDEPLVLLG